MHQDPRLTTRRLARTLQRLTDAWWTDRVPLTVGVRAVPGEPVPVAAALAADYDPFDVGSAWGPPWGTAWFRLTGDVPVRWGDTPAEAVVDLGFDPAFTGFHAEGLVYTPDGEPVKGLNPRTRWIPVDARTAPGGRFDVLVEAAANPLLIGGGGRDFSPSPLGDVRTAGSEPLYRFRQADLAQFESEVWELVQDLEVVGQLAAVLPDADARRYDLLHAVDAALDLLDVTTPDGPAVTAAAARVPLAAVLAVPARRSAHRLSAVGHAHIDSAWLWPTRETVRKVARTAANVVDLLDRDDDLVFAMSSAQQFAWLAAERPEVFERVRAAVAAGRFVPVGGMWVESDTNLPGGEALARQFSHGKRWFLQHFGIETSEVWLPDSFGYSAALPQLVALSGSRWFLTQKISWNQTNRFPHHTFWWEGLDGTRVFTHFPPADTYNSEVSAAELTHAAANFAEKGGATTSLLPFGWGDGGGGPTREMLARARRTRDLDGSPTVRVEAPRAFFERAHAEYGEAAPVWVGELYLEFHRGTYTSQARTKQGNRRSEHLLREAELWAATAAVRNDVAYPHDELDRIWELVLLQQFHDILPGSSIHWVHREAVANYATVAAGLDAIVAASLASLAGEGEVALTFNATPDTRDGVAPFAAEVGSTGPAAAVGPDGEGWLLDNGRVRVHVDRRGLVTSMYDLGADREVIAPGGVGHLLQLHRDTPNAWDAWDLDRFYRNTVTDLTGAATVQEVPAGVRVTRRFGASTVVSTLTLPPDAARLDVETVVDWHERETLLKVGFDVDVDTLRFASEIAFGHVHRPTHANTSWDAAMFETPAHRWVHVGDARGFGVAVANDSTYGHDVTRRPRAGGGSATRMRLSLLRAPRSPDPEADQGEHRLRYSLVSGATITDAVREGYRINLPTRTVAGALPVEPLVRVDATGVVVESVKLADDRSGDVVVRLYEALGGRADAAIVPGFPAVSVTAVDLLERDRDEPDVVLDDPARVTATLRPFQILTLRWRRP